ncbi:MAG: hypothetical protein FWF77_04390 [Defluviitaleaceae bacterium]|nr:hypothetical protein [Defluviitaleaceae bacterium]
MKKSIAIVLSLVLLSSVGVFFAGCAGGAGGDAPVQIVIYSQLANFSGEQRGWAGEVFLEEFNAVVQIIPDADGTFATRMEAGFLGDIVLFGSSGREYLNAVEAGMLFDWEEDDLVQTYGPFIWENMRLALETNRELSGGRIHGFGFNVAQSGEDHEDFFYYPYIRWDLYVELGMPYVGTLEDFIPVLEAMVALEPYNEFGQRNFAVSFFPDWDGDMVMMVKSTGALYGYDEFGFGLYCTQTQTFQPIFYENGQYLRALRFYNQLFQRGLMDPDSMTQTFDDMREKYLTGRAMWNIFSWMADPFNTEENMAEGRAMMPLAASDQRNIVYGLNPFGGTRVWTIGAQSAHPELAMQIINWFSTPEGSLTFFYGPRGIMWDYNAYGNTYLTELGLLAQQDADAAIFTMGDWTGSYREGEFQHNLPTWAREATNPDSADGECFNWEVWRSTLETRYIHPIEQHWRDHFNAVRADDYLISRGHYSISIGSTFQMARRDSEFELIWNQIAGVIRSGTWRALYAENDEEFEEIVAEMIENAYAFGLAQAYEWLFEQAALRRAAEEAAMGR